MKHTIKYPIIILAALFSVNIAFAETTASTDNPEQAIKYLLDFIANSDCTFIRNGKSYAPKEALEHIKAKYEYFKTEIKTPEDFIRFAATKSELSGKPYLVKFKDGKEMECAEWLSKALDDYRKSQKKEKG